MFNRYFIFIIVSILIIHNLSMVTSIMDEITKLKDLTEILM